MIRPWTTRSSKYLLERWWMKLREDHVVLPHGTELPEFHVVEYPDWALSICVDRDDRYVMVEQYRHGIGRASLEFASGAIDPGESPEAGARRELAEETGYGSDRWVRLGRWAPEPSKHTNWAHLYVALESDPRCVPAPDPGEDLGIVLLTANQVREAAHSGRIVHGMHLAALWAGSDLGVLPGF